MVCAILVEGIMRNISVKLHCTLTACLLNPGLIFRLQIVSQFLG